jgi:hypothetical protein
MKFLLRVLFLAALLAPGLAAAQEPVGCTDVRGGISSPIAIVQVNDICLDLSGRIVQSGKLFVLDTELTVDDLATIDLNVIFNPDPFITFTAATTNLVAGPTTFAFLFGTPIVPDFYTTASSSAGVTVTNSPLSAVTVDNSAIHPFYVSGYGTNGLVPTNLGVDIGTDPCTAAGTAPDTTVCDQGDATNTFAPAFYDNLEALLTYTQTGIATAASWTGSVILEVGEQQVPEPATVTLLAISSLALGVVGFARRRRHQG